MEKVIDDSNLGYLISKIKTYVLANRANISAVTTPQDGTIVIALTDGNTITVDLNHSHDGYFSRSAGSYQPYYGFLPDVVYRLGTITGSVTFDLDDAESGCVNHYFWTFETSYAAPSVTFPSGITWADGEGPTIAANMHYEISILGGIACYLEVEL